MKNNKFISLIVFALVLSNLYLFSIVLQKENSQGETPKETTVNKVVTEFDTSITKLVEETQNKVVSIITQKHSQNAGSGSGIVYKNKDGKVLIVTNHHVIDGGDSYIVRFANGEEIEATLLGSDQYTDLALLEVKADLDIEPFELGDSALSKVGEFVIAIGSPLGVEFENSVTFGIISGKNRMVPVDLNNDGISDWDMHVLQTDAAINPGNSGGALVNMAGELVGINSLKFSSDSVEGMGFSIPVNEMIPIIKQIEETGKVVYPIIGISAVSIKDLNGFQKVNQNIPNDVSDGVLIVEITKDSPADKAKLESGDIMTSYNGESVKDFKDFRRNLYKNKVGDSVKLGFIRDGQEMEVDVILE